VTTDKVNEKCDLGMNCCSRGSSVANHIQAHGKLKGLTFQQFQHKTYII